MQKIGLKVVPILILSFVVLTTFGVKLSYATFINDTVKIEHRSPTFGTAFDTHYPITVMADSSDRVEVTAHSDKNPTYGVDVGASGFFVDFIRYTNFTVGDPFHGVVVSDLNWSAGGTITGATVKHNGILWATNRLTYGSDWLSLNWQGMAVKKTDTFEVTIQTAVPEPTTVALLGIGLVGLAGAEVRRRRKKKVVDNS